MYDLRYPMYVDKLLEGTEGTNDEMALRTALKTMFYDMEEEEIRLLFSLLRGIENPADDTWDSSCDPVKVFVEFFKADNQCVDEPDSPADFLDRLATIMMDEFDAYDASIPIPDDLI